MVQTQIKKKTTQAMDAAFAYAYGLLNKLS